MHAGRAGAATDTCSPPDELIDEEELCFSIPRGSRINLLAAEAANGVKVSLQLVHPFLL